MKPSAAIPRQVTILGLGLFGGGVGAARYFAERGSRVIVSDSRKPEALAESVAALDGLKIEYHLGAHEESDFKGSEIVVVNPGVAPNSPAFAMAERSGARLETEINLLLKLCPAPVAAVTGTNGKSTTVALLGEMMRATGRGGETWVGGNLGGSLLPQVDEIRAGDIVVLEISSFQSQRLAWAGISPHLAMVLNITPNHLDRHADMAEYAAAKKQLLLAQKSTDVAILNGADKTLRTWQDAGQGKKFFFGAEPDSPRGIRLEDARVLMWREGEKRTEVSLTRMRIPGAHNRFNAACAAGAAWLLGADTSSIESALATFPGLPDRIEFVADVGGVKFYNDSIATTPESTFVALDSFDSPIILIAGGSSKGLSFAELGKRIASRAKAVVLIGSTAREIEEAIRNSGLPQPHVQHAGDMAQAVTTAYNVAASGDAVLMSPACASFDMFRNYAERGSKFRESVFSLPQREK